MPVTATAVSEASSTILALTATPTSDGSGGFIVLKPDGNGHVYAPAPMMEGCYAPVSWIWSLYGYNPTLAAGIAICLLFSLSFSAHVVRGIQLRRWTSFLCILGAFSETVGWGARAYSGNCPYNKTAFIIQIVTLIIAPVFFAACIYLILGRLVTRKGPQYSFLNPKTYLWIFCTCDVVSLLVQAGGGAIASEEAEKNESTKVGSNIIVAGIIFQLITMLSFSVCGISFLMRSRHAPQPKKETIVTYGAVVAFICIFIRNCYRTVAFLQGWAGFLSTHEAYFIALDGCMILIACIVLNISDPAVLLRDDDKHVNNGEVIGEFVTRVSSVYSQMEEPLAEESDLEKPQVEKPRLEKTKLGDWYPQM